jgi:thioredoxin-dependent peroxiredoxin
MFFNTLLTLGSEAPLFSLIDQQGETVYLEKFRGQKQVVLVFYPADFTPVCTQQLCMFRDSYESLSLNNIAVLGINPGEWTQHQKFAEQHQLPFPLLYDPRGKVAKLYNASIIPGILIQRCVYGIDLNGKIVFAKKGNPSAQSVFQTLQSPAL